MTVYVSHIGKDDAEVVLAKARSVGMVVAYDLPHRSRKANRMIYDRDQGWMNRVPEDSAYSMRVTMATGDQARSLINVIGQDPWDRDESFYSRGSPAHDEPQMYAVMAKKQTA